MSHHEEHETPYGLIFGALIVLTVVTVGVAYIDMGNFNIVVAMLVASVKATLVAVFFMHLKFENWITRFYAIVPIILLAIMIGGVFLDNPYRVDPRSPVAIAEEKEKQLADLKKFEKEESKNHH
jgi:cytochrome c oxidase subunit IV